MKLFVAVVLCLSLFGASATTVVSVSPKATAIHIGEEFVLDVVINGLDADRSIGVFDTTIRFDAESVSFRALSFGSQLDLFGLGSYRSIEGGAGYVRFFELSLESANDLNALQLASFSFASIQFRAIGEARDTRIDVEITALGDAYGAQVDAEVTGGTVSISVVDEPSQSALMAFGMLFVWLAALARRSA